MNLTPGAKEIVNLQSQVRQARMKDFFKGIGNAKIYFFDLSDADINIINQAYAAIRAVLKNKEQYQNNADALATAGEGPVDQIRQAEAIINNIKGGVNVHSSGTETDVTAGASAALDAHGQAVYDRNINGAKIDLDKAKKSKRLKLLKENSTWDYGTTNSSMRRIAFVKLGDIINNILQNINPRLESDQKMPNLVTLLGEIRFRDALTQKNIFMNIAEIPIEIKLFNNFLVDKIIGEGLNAYSFFNFLEDLLTELIVAAFDSCLAAGSNHAIELSTLPMTSTLQGGTGTDGKPRGMIEKGERVDAIKLALLKGGLRTATDGYSHIKNTYNYMILYGSGFSPTGLRGNYKHDVQNKIYHFILGGPDSGLLKKITFGKINNPKWTVALYATNIRDRNTAGAEAGLIKPQMFNVVLKLIGNPLFNIGQKFYIDSTFLDGGQSNLHRLAFGGYYTITKVTNIFTAARYETEIAGVCEVPDWAAKESNKEQQEKAVKLVKEDAPSPADKKLEWK